VIQHAYRRMDNYHLNQQTCGGLKVVLTPTENVRLLVGLSDLFFSTYIKDELRHESGESATTTQRFPFNSLPPRRAFDSPLLGRHPDRRGLRTLALRELLAHTGLRRNPELPLPGGRKEGGKAKQQGCGAAGYPFPFSRKFE